MILDQVIGKCIDSGDLTREEIVFLLRLEDKDDIARLLKAGDTVRREYCGDAVQIRGLVEFSNFCARPTSKSSVIGWSRTR